MQSMKIHLPMAHDVWRTYAVTLSEQQDLARRFGITMDQVRSELQALTSLLNAGEVTPQKSATKMRRVINSHFESSNATGRQGA